MTALNKRNKMRLTPTLTTGKATTTTSVIIPSNPILFRNIDSVETTDTTVSVKRLPITGT